MKRIDELTEEQRKRMVRWGIIIVVSMFIIFWAEFYFFDTFLFKTLNLTAGSMSLFAGVRIILTVFYLTLFLPSAMLCELADSRVNERSYRARNIILFFLFFGEVVLVAAALLTLFDVFFSKASLLVQFPLTAISVSIPSLVVVFTFRMKKIHGYIEKAFSNV